MIERKIINQAKSFKDLDKTLKKLIKNKKAKLAGSVFEYLTKLYLEVSPEYKTKLRKVYLLNEVPTALKKKLRLPNTDEGIDLIAETFDNEYWAIQCKYRSDNTETLKVKGDLATFNNLAFTVCKNISHGIVAATVNRPPKKTKLLSVGYILLTEWLSLDRDNGDLFNQIKSKAAGKISRPKLLSPRPHQKAAIAKTISYFKSNERGKMIMPCGTGKSLTAFWIAEKMKPKSILVAVPSLALLQQTLKVWTREFLLHNIEPDWLCVCSDDTVKEEQDDFVTFSADLGIKVDTDPRTIRNFLRKKTNKLKIVFTTYQSGRATAIGSKGFNYDLGIMDEAHKTVGSGSKPMAHLLHQKNIKIKKRLFMTATERLFKGDSDEYMSMDDPRDYGNLIYELTFKDAINAKPPIISDYQILTFGISNPEIEEITQSNKYLQVKKELKDITARELATAIALRKAIKKLKIKNAISFHRSIRRAENFRKQQDLISKVYPTYGKLKTFHVRGDMPTSDRALEMLSFEEEKGLMTNARCLTEGVDLPAIDCVCFTDPKRSKVDIVQAAGRALRLSKGKNLGYILIPIFVPDGMTFDEAAEEQGFDDVSITVRALASSDTRIVEYLKAISEGKKPKGGSPVEGITSINELYNIDSEKFNNAVQLKVWDKVSKLNWRSFEDAREVVSKLNLKNETEFRDIRRKRKDLWDIPSSPDVTYGVKWKGWGHFLKSRSRSHAASIEEASEFAIQNNIKSGLAWKKFVRDKNNLIPYNIPKSPEEYYKARGKWISWPHFLKVNTKTPKKIGKKIKLSLIKEIVIKNKITNIEEYKNFARNNPNILIPANLNSVEGYNSAEDLFGPKFIEFDKLKELVKKYKINNWDEYKKFYLKNKKKFKLPSNPANLKAYKKQWKNSEDFFGISNEFDFEKCANIMKKYNLKSSWEYDQLKKKTYIPNVPRQPKEYFTNRNKWEGWPKYLGYEEKKFYEFKVCRKIVRNLGFKNVKDFISKKHTLDSKIPKAPDLYYTPKGVWKGWPDFLGKK